jgi:hypothetical protein
MIQQQNYLNFSNRPLTHLHSNYPKFEWFPKNNYTTLLHGKAVAIRSIVVLALMGLAQAVFRSSVLRKPLLIVGILMLAKIILSNCRKDPLVELFKGEHPRIRINQGNESICDAIKRLKWNDLTEPFYQGETKDGRKVFIARGISTKKEHPITVQTDGYNHSTYAQNPSVSVVTPSIYRLHVYIQGFNPIDREAYPSSSYHDRRSSAADNVLFYQPENYSLSFSNAFAGSRDREISCETECSGTISAAEAFEILAQLDQRSSS